MSLKVDYTSQQSRSLFFGLEDPEDIAAMLDVPYDNLLYWIYRTPERRRYRTLTIPKKSGGLREIEAPSDNIKILQQKLNSVLKCIYRPKPSVHGFALGKSVRTNAEVHAKKHWIFNVDLQNFFHQINFGRVRGMFMSEPYNRHARIATILAHMSCHQGRLPQGAPTSPVISNMVCGRMDSQLQTLAKNNHSTYTRYADDITFSTTRRTFPSDIAYMDSLGRVRAGDLLREVIKDNGFRINRKKVWLAGKHNRQVVTGVVVNAFPNVPRRFTNQIRAMIHAWHKHGLAAAQEEWERRYHVHHGAPWHRPPKFSEVLQGKIEYLGMIRGLDCPVYLKYLDQLNALDATLATKRGTPMRLLRSDYNSLATSSSVSRQERGRRYESIISQLFRISGIEVVEQFRRNSGGEQIDGAFTLGNRHYLVECKWEERLTGQGDVDSLSGKISRSGSPTMGVLISVNGWSSHVEGLVKQNPDKRLLLANGEDIEAVLSREIGLKKMIREKERALSIRSEPFLSVNDIS